MSAFWGVGPEWFAIMNVGFEARADIRKGSIWPYLQSGISNCRCHCHKSDLHVLRRLAGTILCHPDLTSRRQWRAALFVASLLMRASPRV